MINVSGHLRNERRVIGYADLSVPLSVNCCGWQVFNTRDYSQQRTEGRLDYQIIYIYKGAGHYFLNGSWKTVSAGNILLFRPHEPQVYSYYASDHPDVYWLHFTGSDCERILDRYQIESAYIGENLSVKLLFQDIMTELQLKKPMFNDIVVGSLYKMFALIHRSCQQSALTSQDSFSIDRLIMHLNQKYAEAWTISTMAAYCRLSESYFSHTFKQYTGTSPMRFLNELRMEKAKILLSADTMTISTIAALVGYEDPLYFSRSFKKYTGISPREFQRTTFQQNTPEWWPDQ
ncbi:MAG: AraC family transcriptional regulator [Lachnospiraceae bacterium]|nr:AraC family transcriptional regulator [Lachnospiraceae bacterium]